MANDAIFSELIDVSFDVAAFEQSLDNLISVYQQKMSEMEANGFSSGDFGIAGMAATVTEDLSQIQNALNVLADGFLQRFEEVSSSVVETNERIATSSTTAATKTDSEWKATLESQLNNLAKLKDEGVATYQQITEAMHSAIDAKVNFGALTDSGQKMSFDAVQSGDLYENLSAKQKLWYAKFEEDMEQLAAKDNALQSENADKSLLREQQLTAKKEADLERLAAKDAALQSEIADKEAMARTQAEEKVQQKRLQALAEYKDLEQARLNQAYIKELEIAEVKSKTFTQGVASGFRGNDSGNLAADMGEMLGSVTRFQLLWSGVGAILNGVQAVVQGIANGIKEGWTYLNELEQKSDEMRGVLLDNVKFSDNLATNYQLAGDNAKKVVEALQDVASKDGLDATQLTSAFKALAEGGGANYAKDLQDMVNLTEMFGLAMKASGKETQVTRSLINDIPKLLDNTISDSSKLLEVLHVTKSEWSDIRAHALETGNLYAELEPRLAPYLDAMQQAQLHQQALNRNLDLMKERMEAAIVQPVWEWWTGVLLTTYNYIKQHSGEWATIAKVFTGFFGDFMSFFGTLGEVTGLTTLFKDLWSIILDLIKGVGAGLTIVVGSLRIVMDSIEFVANALHRLLQYASSPSQWGTEGWKKAIDDITNYAAQAKSKMEDAAGQTVAAIAGDSTSADRDLHGRISANHSSDDKSKKKKESNAELLALEHEYTNQLKQIMSDEAEKRKEIDSQEKQNAIDAVEASKQRVASHDREYEAVKKLSLEYDNLQKTKKGTPQAHQTFEGKLNENVQLEVNKDLGGTATEAGKQAKIEQDIEKQKNTAIEKDALQHAKNLLTIYKQEASEGLHSKVEVFDKEREVEKMAHDARMNAALQELVAAGANVQKRQKAMQDLVHENQDYTDKTTLNAKIREALLTDEANKAALHESTMAHLAFTEQEKEAQFVQAKTTNANKIRASNTLLSAAYLEMIANDRNVAEAELNTAIAMGATTEVINKKREALEKLNDEEIIAAENAGKAQAIQDTQDPNGKSISDKFKDAFDGFQNTVNTMQKAFNFFQNSVNAIKQGIANGGVMGGMGAGMGSVGGLLSGIGGKLGPWGAALSFAGSMFSAIGDMFTAAAKHIAEEIKTQVSKIMDGYNAGNTTLANTVVQLQQERQDAINRLSGKKGGQDQLKTLLPEIDKQIATLQKQQKDLQTAFENTAFQLHLHSSELAGINKNWSDINKQVKDYLDSLNSADAAKGAALASQYLSDQLQNIQQDAASKLSSAQSTAIQDAQKLNDLLTQRIALVKQYNADVFGAQTQDALERRVSGAVVTGMDVAQKKADFQTQLADLDQQIGLSQAKVDLEKQVFNIASDTATLKAQAAAIELQNTQQTLSSMRDLLSVYTSITQLANGQYSITDAMATKLGLDLTYLKQFGMVSGLPAGNTTSVGAVHINLPPGDYNGSDIANEFTNALQQRGRYGYGSSLQITS